MTLFVFTFFLKSFRFLSKRFLFFASDLLCVSDKTIWNFVIPACIFARFSACDFPEPPCLLAEVPLLEVDTDFKDDVDDAVVDFVFVAVVVVDVDVDDDADDVVDAVDVFTDDDVAVDVDELSVAGREGFFGFGFGFGLGFELRFILVDFRSVKIPIIGGFDETLAGVGLGGCRFSLSSSFSRSWP